MFVDFCKTGTPSVSPSVRLWTVYHLKADHSYRVCHRPFPTGKAVLVMTISGKGFLENQGFRYTLEPGSVLLFTPDQGDFFIIRRKRYGNFGGLRFRKAIGF